MFNYKMITEKTSNKVRKIKEKYGVQSVNAFQSNQKLFGVEIMAKGVGLVRGWGHSEREAFKNARKVLKTASL